MSNNGCNEADLPNNGNQVPDNDQANYAFDQADHCFGDDELPPDRRRPNRSSEENQPSRKKSPPMKRICDDIQSRRFSKFCAIDKSFDWLIHSVLAPDLLTVIGAYAKVGKTGIALDLAMSIASGSPFLGKFDVTTKGPVIFYNGETGELDFERQARAIARNKGLDVATDFDDLYILDGVPNLTNPQFHVGIEQDILETGAIAIIIDSGYQALPNCKHGTSSSEIEAWVQPLKELGKKHHFAPIISIHVSKGAHRESKHSAKSKSDEVVFPEISWLSGDGWSQIPRQYIMLNRIGEFMPGMPDKIAMAVAGRGVEPVRGIISITERLGDKSNKEDFTWKPEFRYYNAAEAKQAAASMKAAKQLKDQEEKREQLESYANMVHQMMLGDTDCENKPQTTNKLATKAAVKKIMSDDHKLMGRVLGLLHEQKRVELHMLKAGNKKLAPHWQAIRPGEMPTGPSLLDGIN